MGFVLFRDFPPPGVFIGMLALLGVVVPIVRERIGPREKAVWTAAFFVLLILELFAVYAERAASEQRYNNTLDRFVELQKTIVASNQAQSRLLANLQPVAPQPATAPAAPLPLKRRAEILSADILTFLLERQLHEPPLPRPPTWQVDTDKMLKYFGETMALYTQKFGARVRAIHDEFARNGLHDDNLDGFYENPTNPIGVRYVGEAIGALAQRL